MKKKLAILLPSKPKFPIGGYKVAYQYADFFAEIGYDVSVAYECVHIDFFKRKDISVFLKVKTFLGFYYRKFRKQLDVHYWYPFKNNVHHTIVFSFAPLFFRGIDKDTIVFATAVETAYALNALKAIPNNHKFYLIQDFENWNGNSDDYVYQSYTFPLTKIAISKWLQKRVEKMGSTATLIANGLDFDYFKLTTPIEERKPTEIAMLYHLDERKRCCDSMAALDRVKKQIPDLHVTMFGTPEKPADLPDWYSYYRTPDRGTHNMIYNTAAIFVAASEKEGWALPPAEAMQCGAALVCTEIGGFSDYAIGGKSALLSPVYDVQALANNILKLIQDNELRIKIAKAGNEFVQQFTLEKACSSMKALVEQIVGS